jgi:hypothetical protein
VNSSLELTTQPSDASSAAQSALRQRLEKNLDECETVEFPVPPGFLVDDYRRAMWTLLDPARRLKLVTDPAFAGENGREEVHGVCFTPGGVPNASRVGLVALPGCGEPAPVLRVRPKVLNADWPALLSLALGRAKLEIDDAPVTADGWDDPVAVIVRAYLRSLQELGTIRRHFDERRETLRGRVRGRLEVDGWIAGFARGRPERAPCRFSVHDFDNLPNRLLLRALRLCQRLIMLLPEAQRGVGDLVRRAEVILAGVSDDPTLNASDLARVRLPRSFARYDSTAAWPLARWILERFLPVSDPGGRRTIGFSVEMPALFEDALRTALGGKAENWVYQVGNNKKNLKPDIIVEAEALGCTRPATLVVDAKWKTCKDDDQVNESDIYQVLAYARYRQIDADASGDRERAIIPILVYPTTNVDRQEPDDVVFGPGSGRVVCYRVAWPIGRARESALPLKERVLEAIRRCVEQDFQRSRGPNG